MISSNELRNGITLEIDTALWTVIEFLHVKPGKGAAFVRTKLKNVMNGNVIEKTFRAGEKLNRAIIERNELQYLYGTGDDHQFMDNATFEQFSIPAEILGDALKWIKDGTNVNALFYEGKVIGVDAPNFVILEITETDPGVRGDTATGGTKPAKLETGAMVNVPFFVNQGDKIRVDTRTGAYLERA